MRRVASIAGIAALALALASAPGASSAARRAAEVELGAEGPKPPVVVIPPGAEVRWLNDDVVDHTLQGAFFSPPIHPGGTFTLRFAKVGEYRYRDAANEAFRGTIVVEAGGRGAVSPPRSHGLVAHSYAAVVTVRDRESYRFYDGKYRSFHGPCNGEIGEGTRAQTLRVRFPRVDYVSGAGVEVLSGAAPHAKLDQHELVDAHASSDSSPLTSCPDGTTERGPDRRVHCDSRAGHPGGFELGWIPGKNRLLLHPSRSAGMDVCGLAYLGPLGLAGVNPETLPVMMVPSGFAYDTVTAGPLTRGEIADLRAGRRLTVTREVDLSWLDTCCAAWVPPGWTGGVLARIGSAWSWDASMKVVLTPR